MVFVALALVNVAGLSYRDRIKKCRPRFPPNGMVALPDIAGIDPVRGAITVSSVRDLRASSDTVNYVDAQSRDIVSTLPANTPRAKAFVPGCDMAVQYEHMIGLLMLL